LTHPRDIEDRLLNWARWCTSSDGGVAAACITGAICESLRKASLGVLPGGAGGHHPSIDTADAAEIGRGMVRLDLNQRRLLGLHYVDGQRSAYIAALLRFPRHDFEPRMERARQALEAALARMHEFQR
jgi:DNA-directed RNA polymerase specialized sigma24 family protein